MEATEDVFLIDQRVELLAFLAGEDLAVDAPRLCVAELALQVRQAGLRGGHFQSAHLVEAALAILGEGQELFHRVLGEERHGLGGVGLEHQARCVGRGATGHIQGSLVQDGDVVPTAGDQFVGEVGANNPSSDDDNARRGCHGGSPAEVKGVSLLVF